MSGRSWPSKYNPFLCDMYQNPSWWSQWRVVLSEMPWPTLRWMWGKSSDSIYLLRAFGISSLMTFCFFCDHLIVCEFGKLFRIHGPFIWAKICVELGGYGWYDKKCGNFCMTPLYGFREFWTLIHWCVQLQSWCPPHAVAKPFASVACSAASAETRPFRTMRSRCAQIARVRRACRLLTPLTNFVFTDFNSLLTSRSPFFNFSIWNALSFSHWTW